MPNYVKIGSLHFLNDTDHSGCDCVARITLQWDTLYVYMCMYAYIILVLLCMSRDHFTMVP